MSAERRNINFELIIADGHSFKNLIGIIKSEVDRITMIFKPNGVSIGFLNRSRTAIYKAKILKDEISLYDYNIRDENGELKPEEYVAFDTNELNNAAKSVAKKDGIRIYWVEGENHVNIKPLKNDVNDRFSTKCLFVNILTMEHRKFTEGDEYAKDPSLRISAKQFSEFCSEAKTLKCKHVLMKGLHEALTFQGILANGEPAIHQVFKTVNPFDYLLNYDYDQINKELETIASANGETFEIERPENVITTKIPISTVNSLSKIQNISPNGTKLKFYVAIGDKPIKIESPIHNYGFLKVFVLRNEE